MLTVERKKEYYQALLDKKTELVAIKQIRSGESVIEVQLSMGNESGSSFRDAFSKIRGAAPMKLKQDNILKASWLDTPLGPMIAIADDNALYLLEFIDRRGLEKEVERLRLRTRWVIIPGRTEPISSVENELKNYFEGRLQEFKTPLFLLGTPFQKKVWEELRKIPAGETRSYLQIADSIGKPTAVRAVARANGANQLSIIIPCHRVINTNGELGGYGGGLSRKKWLIDHERKLI